MSAATLVAPAPDVLPTGVRRRLGARDALLVLLLLGELLAGLGGRALWEQREALGDLLAPTPAGAATGRPVEATTWVVVPPPPAPPAPPAPPRRTVPRDPFAVQTG